jgi:hypothetical protein
MLPFIGSLTRDFRLQVFHESVYHGPLSITVGPFEFLRKLAERSKSNGYPGGNDKAINEHKVANIRKSRIGLPLSLSMKG